ncbi:hypothetical protein SLS56_004900 [Neofusicoccum ribis]|uniref:RNA 3'-terminal phosphate cyclase domain-containing protein n=1 Tax=Neofusicoccum ribis TaxID=45134 RepID=A0ABR3SVL6_9PEZI
MACVDGTTLEGGGQLLRIAVGLSALTASPIRITRIRANRRGKRGLKAQHLSAVTWLSSASRASTIGAEQQSQTLDFFPRADMFGKASASQKANVIDIGSSGSIGLVFQAILPFILFSGRASNRPFSISIHGGTNVSWSPSYDYIDQVLLPTLSTLGLPPVTATLHQRGWLRGDRGLVTFKITPVSRGLKLQPFRLEKRGAIQRITATILTPPSWQGQAERELSEALRTGFPELDEGAFTINFEKSPQKSLYLLLVATSSNGHKLGRDWLYNEKITAVPVALGRMVKRVTAELASEVRHGGCVDEHMRDQLVVFQALADGYSFVDGGRDEEENMVAPSLHARTAEWVVEKILGARFDGAGGCQGVSFAAGERFAERERAVQRKRNRRTASIDSLRERSQCGLETPSALRRRARSLTASEGDIKRGLLSRPDAAPPDSIVLPMRGKKIP